MKSAIDLAKESGIQSPDGYKLTVNHISIDKLERLVQLVREDERQARQQPAQREPALPDQAQCDRLVELVLKKLASKCDKHHHELSMDIIEHDVLRHSIVQAAYMAGAMSTHRQPAQRKPLTDDEFLELILRNGSRELVGVSTCVGGTMKTPGHVMLLQRSAKIIKEFVEAAHGIKGAS